MAHCDIREVFQIAGHQYQAVGFLRAGERWADEEEMLARVADEHGDAVGEEEAKFLRQRFARFPAALREYHLVTGHRIEGELTLFIYSPSDGWFEHRRCGNRRYSDYWSSSAASSSGLASVRNAARRRNGNARSHHGGGKRWTSPRREASSS